MGKLRERLVKMLAKIRDEITSDKVACRQCVGKLIPFIREQKSIDEFEDFEFDERCEIDTNKRGEKWCWGQIILLEHGKETASLVFKVIGGEFTAEIVDLGSSERNYGLFC